MAGETPRKKPLKASPIGDVHRDLAEVRTAAGKLQRCVAMARACPFAYAAWHAEATKLVAAQCLRNGSTAIPSTIPTGLPDHGLQVTKRTRAREAFDQLSLAHWPSGTEAPSAPSGHRAKG